MIETLISSKTRIKLLLKFFLNRNNSSYLRALENEFGESTNAIRIELNRLEEAGLLQSQNQGNKKYFSANQDHPLFFEIHNIIRKHIGLDKIVQNVIERLGAVQRVYLLGNFARGLDCNIIDLLFIGDIDQIYLLQLIEKVETRINRKIRYLIYPLDEVEQINWSQFQENPLLIWENL